MGRYRRLLDSVPGWTQRQAPAAVAGALLLAACGSSRPRQEAVDVSWAPGTRGAAIQLVASPELDEIARLEDARTTGQGRLQEFLSHPEPFVRARAVQALGRMPLPEYSEEVTEPLCRALDDTEAAVRYAAAFALGLRADPKSAGVLVAYRNNDDAKLRARIVEALSKIDDPVARREVRRSLLDTSMRVRLEAAVGTARWDPDAPDARETDRALVDLLGEYALESKTNERSAREAELVWRGIFALQRRGNDLGRGVFLEFATSKAPLERLFAIRGLARLEPDAESVALVGAALDGPNATTDWRIAYEATVALGRFADPEGLAALFAAMEHDSVHVRAGVIEALGNFPEETKRTLPYIQRGLVDASASVRRAAMMAMARAIEPGEACPVLKRSARDPDPFVRLGIAAAAAEIDDSQARAVLEELAADPNRLVATRAVQGLGTNFDEASRPFLHRMLASEDNGIRLAAIMALREAPSKIDVKPLVRAFESSTGDISTEVAFNALENLHAIGSSDALVLLEKATEDPRPFVRATAARLSEQRTVEAALPTSASDALPEVPVPGRGLPAWRFNPLVEVKTSRGSMFFELFPAEAPIHVYNFLELAQQETYDGLSFHRVVPDFVIQGGDYRGDGNGARPWRGDSLRHEFGSRKYVRGSLGMPRYEDPDSGGSQFFVTHRPTPHLDGRYTIFGELRAGGEVLDLIEVGDRILSVRILEPSGS